jgi:hypothetical protein
MVEHPDAVEPGVLRDPGAGNDLVPGQLVLRDVQTEPHVVPSLAELAR